MNEFILKQMEELFRRFPDLIKTLLKLLESDPQRAVHAIQHAWEQFLQSPDRRQHIEIKEAVTDMLQRQYHLTGPVASRLAVELIGRESDPADKEIQADPLPVREWEFLRSSLLSVEVIYQVAQPGQHATWRRQTRLFVRDENGTVRSLAQEVDLRWDDLPFDVREGCIQKQMTQQRFVPYVGNAAQS